MHLFFCVGSQYYCRNTIQQAGYVRQTDRHSNRSPSYLWTTEDCQSSRDKSTMKHNDDGSKDVYNIMAEYCEIMLIAFSCILMVLTFPFSLCFCLKVVQEYERAVIFRLGRIAAGGAKGPGLFLILPCIDSFTKIDLRAVAYDIPPQQLLSKDSVTVSVDAVVIYRVSDATLCVVNVDDAMGSTHLLAQTTLRKVLGAKNFSEILSDRENVNHVMQKFLNGATDSWGIKVEHVEIKDVRLPIQMQKVMAAEAEASREAKAKVIAAEGVQKASMSLKEASDVISQSP